MFYMELRQVAGGGGRQGWDIFESSMIVKMYSPASVLFEGGSDRQSAQIQRKNKMGYTTSSDEDTDKLDRLIAILDRLDADMGYGPWLNVLMAIFYETKGSQEGFELANEWSSTGRLKYKGEKDVWKTWRYFKPNHPRPITIGTLYRMAKGNY
jgi:hypothetical protein